MAQFKVNKKGVFRVVAVALLALCAGFTFPESHYSTEKTFVKTPSPQTEISSLLCDDVEDSNDFATGVHLFQSGVVAALSLSSLNFAVTTSPLLEVSFPVDDRTYLRHRQLLI